MSKFKPGDCIYLVDYPNDMDDRRVVKCQYGNVYYRLNHGATIHEVSLNQAELLSNHPTRNKTVPEAVITQLIQRVNELSNTTSTSDFRRGKIEAYTEILKELGYARIQIPQPPVYEFRKIN